MKPEAKYGIGTQLGDYYTSQTQMQRGPKLGGWQEPEEFSEGRMSL